MNKIVSKPQHCFHMFPQSLMKFFVLQKNAKNNFISYNFETQTLNKKPLGIKSINSIDFKKERTPKNIFEFEKKLNSLETKYAPFLNNLHKYSIEFDQINVENSILNRKLAFWNNNDGEKFEKKWSNDITNNKINLAQFFYYLTIQLKYFNALFIKNKINEQEIQKLLCFLDLDYEKNKLLTKAEKEWFKTIIKLGNYTYGGSMILTSKNNKNKNFHNAFTSNPLSITRINDVFICFVLPISFYETSTIFFFNNQIENVKRGEYMYSEILRFNSLENPLNDNQKIMPWRFSNYNFWNNDYNKLCPNGNIDDTKLVYYPFEIISTLFGYKKTILNYAKKMNNIKSDELKIKYLQDKNDILKTRIKKLNKGSIFILYYMILWYEKQIDCDDQNFINECNKLIQKMIKEWEK